MDYWNDLGWKDGWSDAAFTERQRSYAELWHSENIYTPEFVLNGREWHNWFTGKDGPKSDGTRVGVLFVASADTNYWRVTFVPEQAAEAHYEIHAALLAGDIVSGVNAGENRGRRLNHDFAVVDLLQIGLTTGNGVVRGKFILNPARFARGKTSALTVWVTRAGDLEPLQTTGGWLVPPGDH